MAINAASIQLVFALMDGSSTVMPSPGEAVTIEVLEAAGGLPHRIAGGISDLNIKLGTLALVKALAVYGDEGITFKTTLTGSQIHAHPFAFLANNVAAGLGISEIWVTNNDADEHTFQLLAIE